MKKVIIQTVFLLMALNLSAQIYIPPPPPIHSKNTEKGYFFVFQQGNLSGTMNCYAIFSNVFECEHEQACSWLDGAIKNSFHDRVNSDYDSYMFANYGLSAHEFKTLQEAIDERNKYIGVYKNKINVGITGRYGQSDRWTIYYIENFTYRAK